MNLSQEKPADGHPSLSSLNRRTLLQELTRCGLGAAMIPLVSLAHSPASVLTDPALANVAHGAVNASDYGMFPVASAADNKKALNSAYAQAKVLGQNLYIPPGTYEIDATDTRTGALSIDQDVMIFGAGRTLTKLKLTNWNKTNGGVLFWVAGGVKADFADLTIEGPNSLDHGDKNSENHICFGILALGDLARVRCFNYGQTKFNQGIKMSYSTGKSGSVELYNCYMRSRGMHVLHTEGKILDPDNVRIVVRNCTFEHDTETMRNPDNYEIQHCLYVNQGVTLDVSDSTFIAAGNGAGSYGITHYGGVGTPRKASLRNVLFLAGVKDAWSTASTASSEAIDCAFGASEAAIVPLGAVTVAKSIFFGRGRVIDGNGHAVNLTIEDCDFLTYLENGNPAGHADITLMQPGAQTWYVKNSRFHDCGPAYSNLLLNGGPRPRLVVENCQFYMTTGTTPIRANAGHLDLINVQNLSTKALDLRSDSGVLDVTINGHVHNGRGYSIEVTPIHNNAIFIRGAENEWTSGPSLRDPIDKIHGAVQLRRGVAPLPVPDWKANVAYAENDLCHANGNVYECKMAGTSASSGTGPAGLEASIQDGTCIWRYVRYKYGSYFWDPPARLTLSWLYDFWPIDISGVPTISKLYLPGPEIKPCSDSNSDALCGSIVHLLAMQAFALGGGGNIVAAGGTRPINSIVRLRYWPKLAKWLEI